jgi:hypothetical protein
MSESLAPIQGILRLVEECRKHTTPERWDPTIEQWGLLQQLDAQLGVLAQELNLLLPLPPVPQQHLQCLPHSRLPYFVSRTWPNGRWTPKLLPTATWHEQMVALLHQAEQRTERLFLDCETLTITLDARPFTNIDPVPFQLCQALYKAGPGQVVGSKDLLQLPGLKGKNLPRELEKLPPELRGLVRGVGGKGYWLQFPPRPSNCL